MVYRLADAEDKIEEFFNQEFKSEEEKRKKFNELLKYLHGYKKTTEKVIRNLEYKLKHKKEVLDKVSSYIIDIERGFKENSNVFHLKRLKWVFIINKLTYTFNSPFHKI